MLAKIVLPLLMPSTTDVKLSSSSTIDAASRDTSEPVIAIAIPMSARLSAGLCGGVLQHTRVHRQSAR
jgi:hypothetical protein